MEIHNEYADLPLSITYILNLTDISCIGFRKGVALRICYMADAVNSADTGQCSHNQPGAVDGCVLETAPPTAILERCHLILESRR